jgi:ABC-type polysaccharide/polyol phosphate export permease
MIAKLPNMESTTAFAVYLCSGLIPWLSFSEVITRGSNAFLENATYLKKLAMPEYVFVLQVWITSGLILSISMVLLLFILLIIGYSIGVTWVVVPVVLFLLMLFALGIALVLSCLNTFFRDIGPLLVSFMQIWMWLTPIVYVKTLIPQTFINIVNFNPLYYYVDSLHQMIVFGKYPSTLNWTVMIIASLTFVVIGASVLQKLRPEIRDVL